MTSDSEGSRRPLGRYRRAILAIVFITILVLLWYGLRRQRGEFHWDLFVSTFANIHWGWFLASLSVAITTYFGRAIRWQVMIRPVRGDASLWNLFVATVIGFTAIVFFGRPGEIVRPYLIAQKEKVSLSSQLAAWLLERIYDLLSVLFLFGLALSQVRHTSTQVGSSMEWILRTGGHFAGILGTVCLAVLIAFGLFPMFVEKRLIEALSVLPERFQNRIKEVIQAFLSGTSSTRSRVFVIQLVIYTFLEWFLIVLCVQCLLLAFPTTAHLRLMDSIIVVGFVAFGGVVQIPGVGGGMQVATVLVLTELFRIPFEVAGGIAILVWFITCLSIVPLGVALALRDGLKWRTLVRIPEMKA